MLPARRAQLARKATPAWQVLLGRKALLVRLAPKACKVHRVTKVKWA